VQEELTGGFAVDTAGAKENMKALAGVRTEPAPIKGFFFALGGVSPKCVRSTHFFMPMCQNVA